MNFGGLSLGGLLLAGLCSLGCQNVYVTVDTRLARDPGLWPKLDDPAYAVTADDERVASTLEFQACADLVEEMLEVRRPQLRRVADPATADLICTVSYAVLDRGAGVDTYPVFGPRFGFGYGYGCGPGYGGFGYVGSEVRTYHRGYLHLLLMQAWVPDEAQPMQRQVLWEARGEHVNDARSLKRTMPYLIGAAGRFWGQATEEPIRVRVDRDDPFFRDASRERTADGLEIPPARNDSAAGPRPSRSAD